MKFVAVALAMCLGIGACTPSATLSRIEAVDAAVEPEADAVLAFTVKRLCRAPLDIIARNTARDPYLALAAWGACPELRRLHDVVQSVLSGDPILPVSSIGLLRDVRIDP